MMMNMMMLVVVKMVMMPYDADNDDVGLCGDLRTGVWPAQKGLIMPLF